MLFNAEPHAPEARRNSGFSVMSSATNVSEAPWDGFLCGVEGLKSFLSALPQLQQLPAAQSWMPELEQEDVLSHSSERSGAQEDEASEHNPAHVRPQADNLKHSTAHRSNKGNLAPLIMQAQDAGLMSGASTVVDPSSPTRMSPTISPTNAAERPRPALPQALSNSGQPSTGAIQKIKAELAKAKMKLMALETKKEQADERLEMEEYILPKFKKGGKHDEVPQAYLRAQKNARIASEEMETMYFEKRRLENLLELALKGHLNSHGSSKELSTGQMMKEVTKSQKKWHKMSTSGSFNEAIYRHLNTHEADPQRSKGLSRASSYAMIKQSSVKSLTDHRASARNMGEVDTSKPRRAKTN